MVRVRVSLVLLTALMVAAVAVDAPAAKRVPTTKEWGGTHSLWPGVRTVVLETRSGTGKGKQARYPAFVDRWGLYLGGYDAGHNDISAAPCDDGKGASYPIPKRLSVTHQGFVAYVVATPINGPRLRVRKHRFSHRDSYVVNEWGLTAQVSYVLKGRFLSPSRATGTVELNVVNTFDDGHVARCRSGQLRWSACPGNLNTFGPPKKKCLGLDPDYVLSDGEDFNDGQPADE